MRIEENQLDATEWFIALIICSTCFGQLYAPHQELETTFVLLPLMMCNALVAGGRRSGAGQQPRHYTPYAAITQVQSRSLDEVHISARNMLSRL